MRITILGSSPLAEPLAQLVERAGHTVHATRGAQLPPAADGAPDLVILAGSRAAVEPLLKSIAESISPDEIVVDATTPTHDDRGGDDKVSSPSGSGWISDTLPRARIVRAFASVPAEALEAVLNAPAAKPAASFSVPMAGDDRHAKAVVGSLMREIRLEPFDLGALATSDALNPGGALWGKALSPVEMLEAVGQLSGDG
jgi:predicted dinucleotide-binding enzyme